MHVDDGARDAGCGEAVEHVVDQRLAAAAAPAAWAAVGWRAAMRVPRPALSTIAVFSVPAIPATPSSVLSPAACRCATRPGNADRTTPPAAPSAGARRLRSRYPQVRGICCEVLRLAVPLAAGAAKSPSRRGVALGAEVGIGRRERRSIEGRLARLRPRRSSRSKQLALPAPPAPSTRASCSSDTRSKAAVLVERVLEVDDADPGDARRAPAARSGWASGSRAGTSRRAAPAGGRARAPTAPRTRRARSAAPARP